MDVDAPAPESAKKEKKDKEKKSRKSEVVSRVSLSFPSGLPISLTLPDLTLLLQAEVEATEEGTPSKKAKKDKKVKA